MPAELRDEIRELRARFWSDRDPDGRAFASLADAYRRADELDEAAELVREGTERLPDFAPGHLVRARVLRDRGETDEALHALQRVLELDPENVEALREAAELARAADRSEEALELWQRLARIEPEDEEIREAVRELKRRHFGLEREASEEPEEEAGADVEVETEEEAAADIEGEPAEDDGSDTEVYTRTMAELYVRQGHTERAVEVYRRLVEARPEDEELRARLEELEAASREGGAEPAAEVPADEEPPAGAGAPALPHDEDVETLAREWADGPGDTGELSTPFAWGDAEGSEGGDGSGPSIGSYFDRLLEWTPAEEDEAVPVESPEARAESESTAELEEP